MRAYRCFWARGESVDVPHEKVKDISTGDVTCFIKPDDTLACVGKKKWLFTSTTVSEIRAAQLPKWGIDPSSGAEGQDYSTKRFKNVKMGYQSLKICAQGHDDVVYCMGENRTTPASSIFGPQPLLDYEPGDSEFGFSLMKDGTPHLLGSPGYPKILNIKSPKLLKYKRIFAHGEGFLTAPGNTYENGSSIPENTLIIASRGILQEGVLDFVITESSYKADRFSIGCLLTDKGKVRCQNLSKKSSPTNQTDVLDNIPARDC